MHADLAIAPPAAAGRRGLSFTTYAFALFVVLWSMHAFYFQLFVPRVDESLNQAPPSARDDPLYVGLWFLLYGAATVLLLRNTWRRGIDLRLLALTPFVALVLLSSLWANDPRSSIVFATMLGLNVVIAAALAITTPPRVLLSVIGWTVVALSAISLVLLLVSPDMVVEGRDRAGLLMSGSLDGVFDHKQAMGTFAAVGLLVLTLMDRTRWLWRATGFAIVATALLLSNALTPLTGYVLVALTFVLANRAGSRRNFIIGLALTLVVAFAAVLPFVDFSWLSEMLGRGATFTGRTEFWELAPGFIAEHPLLGFGYHSFFDTTAFSQVWALRGTEVDFFTPNFHNSVLQVLIDLGLVGLVGYAFVLIGGNLVFLNRTMDPGVSGTLSAMLVLLTLSSASDVTFMTHNTLSTILLFYAFLVAGRDYGEHAPRPALSPAAPSPAQADARLRSRRQLEGAAGRSVLGTLPTLPELTQDGIAEVPPNAGEIDRAVSLLLTRLRAHRTGSAPLAVLVTSGDDARSKSALSLYLALTGTLDGQKVLLVDTDPRGLVTRAVCGGKRPQPGPAGKTVGGESVVPIDGFPGLWLIAPADGAAVEQLVSKDFLVEVADSDLVVIDAPLLGGGPVSGRLIADGRIAAIVFTASATRSTIAAARRALAPIAHDQRLMPVLCDTTTEVS